MRLACSLADSVSGRSPKALRKSLLNTGAGEAAPGPLLLAAQLPEAPSPKSLRKSALRAGATGKALGPLLEAAPLGTEAANAAEARHRACSSRAVVTL